MHLLQRFLASVIVAWNDDGLANETRLRENRAHPENRGSKDATSPGTRCSPICRNYYGNLPCVNCKIFFKFTLTSTSVPENRMERQKNGGTTNYEPHAATNRGESREISLSYFQKFYCYSSPRNHRKSGETIWFQF